MQSHWLQTTISGVHDKMKDIVKLLEHKDDDVSCEKRKEAITKVVNDLCISYCSLAHDYEYLKSTTTTSENTLNSAQQKYVSQSWDDSHPESTVEDAESESEGVTSTEFNHLKTISGELVSESESGIIETEKGFVGTNTMFDYSKLIEENTSIQLELIRRNSEKREMIVELRDQVRRLVSEKEMLQRQLNYYERNIVGSVSSPTRRTMFRDKIFTCSS